MKSEYAVDEAIGTDLVAMNWNRCPLSMEGCLPNGNLFLTHRAKVALSSSITINSNFLTSQCIFLTAESVSPPVK